jgi:hypothetical protein
MLELALPRRLGVSAAGQRVFFLEVIEDELEATYSIGDFGDQTIPEIPDSPVAESTIPFVVVRMA